MRVSASLFALALVACSNASLSASSGGGSDAATDVPPGDANADARDSAEESPPAHACGAAPYVSYHLKAGELLDTSTTQPLAGATLTFDTCPSVTVTTDGAGDAFAAISRGVAFTARVSAPGHVTVIAGEQRVEVDDPIRELRFAQLLPRADATTVIYDYDPSKPSFAFVIQPDATSACGDARGVAIGVADHPEAAVFYMSAGWPMDRTPALSPASVGPIVFVTRLVGTEVRSVAAQMSNPAAPCFVEGGPPSFHQTGRFVLEPGAWTIGNVAKKSR